MKAVVGKSAELMKGSMKRVRLGPIPVVLIRTKTGVVRAYVDRCLHMGAPLSKGELGWSSDSSSDVGDYRVERDGEILRCPWHGYEYDVRTGATVFDQQRKLRRITVIEEDGDLILES